MMSTVSKPTTVIRLGEEEAINLLRKEAAVRERLIKERPRDKLRYLKNGVLLVGGFLGAGMKGYNFALDITEARRKRNEKAWLDKNMCKNKLEEEDDDEDSNDLMSVFPEATTTEDAEEKTTEDAEEKTSSMAEPIYWVFNKLGSMVRGGE